MNRGDIVKLRKKLNFDQKHLADVLAYSKKRGQNSVSEIEGGKRPISPQIERMLQAVRFLHERGILTNFMEEIGINYWIICPNCEDRVEDDRHYTDDVVNIICPWCNYRFTWVRPADPKDASCVVL